MKTYHEVRALNLTKTKGGATVMTLEVGPKLQNMLQLLVYGSS